MLVKHTLMTFIFKMINYTQFILLILKYKLQLVVDCYCSIILSFSLSPDTLDDSWLSTRSSENPLDKSKTKVKVTARGRGQVKVKDSELSRGHSGRSGTERGRGRR